MHFVTIINNVLLLAMKYLVIGLLSLFLSIQVIAQPFNVIQVTGITMTADSLQAVPDVAVMIKGKDMGNYSNYMGVFTLVCYPGDVLEFSKLGYQTVVYKVPNVSGKYMSMVQLMTQDTFYISETVINPHWSKEDLLYAIRYEPIPEDNDAVMKRNLHPSILGSLISTMPRYGAEAQAAAQLRQSTQAYYYGQNAPQGIMNPLKWNQFFQAWKRGDFKRKK